MLDGVRGTHCATPKKEGEEEKKKAKNLTRANRLNHSYSQTYKLFTGSFETVYSGMQMLPSSH